MPRCPDLNAWLAWQATCHKSAIDLTLDRVRTVAERLALLAFDVPVITVAGTNGKGSTVALLESIYSAQGYKTGCLSSPHVIRYNERIRIGKTEAPDDAICHAFHIIDEARGDITLTYFEFGLLAGLYLCKNVDVLILEVGLGGRLDAANIIDADVAVITSVDLDHQAYLGDTREAIGFEKAHIMRANAIAVIGDPNPPATVLDYAQNLSCKTLRRGDDFSFTMDHEFTWTLSPKVTLSLPRPKLAPDNAATALAVCYALNNTLPVTLGALRLGIADASLPGRCQWQAGAIPHLLDVGHNPHSMGPLREALLETPHKGQRIAVFSQLTDKDIVGTISAIEDVIDSWYVAPMTCERAATKAQLDEAFANTTEKDITFFNSIADAYESAQNSAKPGDVLVIFGSFYIHNELSVLGLSSFR